MLKYYTKKRPLFEVFFLELPEGFLVLHVVEHPAHIDGEVSPALPVVGGVHEVEETLSDLVAIAVGESDLKHFFISFSFCDFIIIFMVSNKTDFRGSPHHMDGVERVHRIEGAGRIRRVSQIHVHSFASAQGIYNQRNPRRDDHQREQNKRDFKGICFEELFHFFNLLFSFWICSPLLRIYGVGSAEDESLGDPDDGSRLVVDDLVAGQAADGLLVKDARHAVGVGVGVGVGMGLAVNSGR